MLRAPIHTAAARVPHSMAMWVQARQQIEIRRVECMFKNTRQALSLLTKATNST